MGLGLPELLVILCIFMLIFGANRLPEIGRGLGKGIRSFKDATRQGMSREGPGGRKAEIDAPLSGPGDRQ